MEKDQAQDSGSENVEQVQDQDNTSTNNSDVESEDGANETPASDRNPEERSRESLLDEIATLRSENAKKRRSLSALEKSFEEKISSLEAVITEQNTQIRNSKIKALGVEDDKLPLFDAIEDEETALTLARLIASKSVPVDTSSADLNQKRGVKPSRGSTSARDDLIARLNRDKS